MVAFVEQRGWCVVMSEIREDGSALESNTIFFHGWVVSVSGCHTKSGLASQRVMCCFCREWVGVQNLGGCVCGGVGRWPSRMD